MHYFNCMAATTDQRLHHNNYTNATAHLQLHKITTTRSGSTKTTHINMRRQPTQELQARQLQQTTTTTNANYNTRQLQHAATATHDTDNKRQLKQTTATQHTTTHQNEDNATNNCTNNNYTRHDYKHQSTTNLPQQLQLQQTTTNQHI